MSQLSARPAPPRGRALMRRRMLVYNAFMPLDPIAPDIWTAPFPHVFGGLRLGTRMTVVRLSDGSLFVHSPIPLDGALRAQLDALGPVSHVVAPSLLHHVYFGEFASAFPDAKTHAAEGLREKRKDLSFDETLSARGDASWEGELRVLAMEGSRLGELLFFHEPSRTLVTADFIQNFSSSEHWPTRWYLKAAGIHQRTGVSRAVRLMLRDKTLARRAIDRVIECAPERITMAHGEPIREQGKEAVREAYAWLKG